MSDGAGVKISLSRLGQLPPLACPSPLRRTARASASSRFRVAISSSSSAIVRAAVAWSRISSSAASTSWSGASSRSSIVLASRAGTASASIGGLAAALEQLHLAEAALEPFPAAPERLVDRLGRGREPPLQDGEREADRAGPLVVLERVGAVELLADVLGDVL